MEAKSERTRGRSLLEMKHLSECVAPLSWLILCFYCYLSAYILLHPTVKEVLVLFFFDAILFYKINSLFEGKVFQKIWPDTALYFEGIDDQVISQLSLSEKVQFVESMLKYPGRRGLFFVSWGMIKVLPALCIIVFYWEHSISNLQQFFIALAITLVNFAFIVGAVLLHSHIFLSKRLVEIHRKHDWAEVFELVDYQPTKNYLAFQGIISLLCLFAFVLILQWSFIASADGRDLSLVALKCLAIGFTGLALFAHNWFLSTNIFLKEMGNILESFKTINYRAGNAGNNETLPLHTIPIIGYSQKTFNSLVKKIRLSELEIGELISKETERGRYEVLGEISGLIAHDLSGPLHVAQFCYNELSENEKAFEDKSYMDKLGLNIHRAIELVESLRAKIKNKQSEERAVVFNHAHSKVTLLLETQFFSLGFSKIRFQVSPEVGHLKIKMAQIDLIHLLDNLYRNSTKNLLTFDISSPTIGVSLKNLSGGVAQIVISDNGKGLSRALFEEMTQTPSYQRPHGEKEKGLGLRLIRRLVELNNGLLEIIDYPSQPGTHFLLTIPVLTEEKTALVPQPSRSYHEFKEIQHG